MKSNNPILSEVVELYGIPYWSGGYFFADPEGLVRVNPSGRHSRKKTATFISMIEELVKGGYSLPFIFRFPQVLESRLREMNVAFAQAIKALGYEGHYQGVFPIKVNQRRLVVHALTQAGRRHRTGLEAGSKAELALCLSREIHPEALVCCNGFKDDDFIRLALLGSKLGYNVVITLEKLGELARVLRLGQELGIKPRLGVRFKLHARGSGKWEDSGGDSAKFGLSAGELITAVESLRENGLLDQLVMLHMHVGSQITDIKTIQTAVREVTQTYVSLIRMGARVQYLNLGGGLAVDYDGSKTTSDDSANYGLREYADAVVQTVLEVCSPAHVVHPTLVTESGRALTAHHSVLILPVIESLRLSQDRLTLPPHSGDAHPLVQAMESLLKELSEDNYRKTFHDAMNYKDTMHSLFDLGYLRLVERAYIEKLFNQIMGRLANLVQELDYFPDDFDALSGMLSDQYVCNFSLFQSLADHWAIDAQFPVIPLSRLNEKPTVKATLVDISCDSDGKMTKFIDLYDVKTELPVHELKSGEPYYLGVFLTGAYQDVLAADHNLFGRVNEAHIEINGPDEVEIQEIVEGETAIRLIEDMGYDIEHMRSRINRRIGRALKLRQINVRQSRTFQRKFEAELASYTYLDD